VNINLDLSSPYLKNLENYLGRIFSILDNEVLSESRGSFDRTWWCWKFTDFSASRFQEGGFALAWIMKSKKYFKFNNAERKKLLSAFENVIIFWSSLQNNDGSFNEAYPYERSLAATAFSTFYLASALELLKDEVSEYVLSKGMNTIKEAADWLSRNDEHHGILSNHLAAAAAAIQVTFDLTNQQKYLVSRNKFLDKIYKHQDFNEGWYMEYSGADPGYQSHCMFYLTDIFKRTQNQRLLRSLEMSCDFIIWFAHPDGTFGGEYASRGTKFSFPAAFEYLSSYIQSAKKLAHYFKKMILEDKLIGINEMDPWNFFPMFNNYLFADNWCRDNKSLEKENIKFPKEGRKIFNNAGFVIINNKKFSMVFSGKMGGSIKVWNSNGDLIYEDLGYFFSSGNFKYSSHTLSHYKIEEEQNCIQIVVKSKFIRTKSIRFNSLKFILFRTFNITIGRVPMLSKILKIFLVFILINKKNFSKASLLRKIIIKDSGKVLLSDKLYEISSKPYLLDKNVPFHMGSARYTNFKEWFGASMQKNKILKKGTNSYVRNVDLSMLF
tara:strand:- start:486 stop:2138 length:1653 start_codon:yes stop_codon:yes gene_type:complete